MGSISLKDWFYTRSLTSPKMTLIIPRMCDCAEFVEATLQNGAFRLQTDQSGQPVLANGKRPLIDTYYLGFRFLFERELNERLLIYPNREARVTRCYLPEEGGGRWWWCWGGGTCVLGGRGIGCGLLRLVFMRSCL